MARGNLSETAQARIRQLILDRKLGPGDPLPTESELSALLDMSRNSVREALKALQAVRVIEIRHGFGTYVGSLSLDPLVDGIAFRAAVRHRQGEPSLYELMELREALESGVIATVAATVPADDLDTLDGLVRQMEREASTGAVDAATDRAFHLALYRSLGNHLLSEVLDAFWAAMRQVRDDLADDRQDPHRTCAQHAEIVAALRAGDGARAAEAMRRHFDGIRKRLPAA